MPAMDRGHLLAVSPSELWLRNLEGTKQRLFISQLHKGKVALRLATGRE